MYKELKRFTLISFQTSITDQECNLLTTLAESILPKYRNLATKFDKDFKIYSKLHTMTHFGDLVRKFGPPYQFGVFRWERKHRHGKKVARGVQNFINLAYTIHEHHQKKRALDDDSNEPSTSTITVQADPTIRSLPKSLKTTNVSSNDRPFKLNKNILRRIYIRGRKSNSWFYAKDFLRRSDGKIYCQGYTYRSILEPNKNGRFRGHTIQKWNDSLICLKRDKEQSYILLEDLYFANSFLFDDGDNSYLLQWILE